MEQEERVYKCADYAHTCDSHVWKCWRNKIDNLASCNKCMPGHGCHGRERRLANLQDCWKRQRKTQYKTVNKW